jgi:hypothetical protein
VDTTLSVVLLLLVIASYIIVGVRLMRFCDASGVSLGWFSFIPGLAETRLARLGGMNPWLVLIGLIPVVGQIIVAILGLVWTWRIATHTNTKQWWWIALLLPIGVGLASSVFSGSVALGLIVAIVGIAVGTYARFMIFDPTQPMPADAIQGSVKA